MQPQVDWFLIDFEWINWQSFGATEGQTDFEWIDRLSFGPTEGAIEAPGQADMTVYFQKQFWAKELLRVFQVVRRVLKAFPLSSMVSFT